MTNGIPLTDTDRIQWLSALSADIIKWRQQPGKRVVLACSALKYKYRLVLRGLLAAESIILPDTEIAALIENHTDTATPATATATVPIVFFLLLGSADSINIDIQTRQGHFFNPLLLQSQLAALELPIPTNNEPIIIITRTIGLKSTVECMILYLKQLQTQPINI